MEEILRKIEVQLAWVDYRLICWQEALDYSIANDGDF